MTRFAATLRHVRDRLTIRQPARSRVLLEIAADMEDLFRLYRDQGCSEEEAKRRTLENLDLSDHALEQLARVHSTPVRRLLDRLSSRTRRRWERVALLLIVVPIAWTATHLVTGGQIFSDAGPFVWPLLLAAMAAVVLGLIRFYAVFLKQDHDARRLHRGMGLLLGIAGVQLGLGFGGMYIHLFQAYHRGLSDKLHGPVYLIHWLHQSSALLTVALMTAILSALLWLLLTHRVARIEENVAAFLLEDTGAGAF